MSSIKMNGLGAESHRHSESDGIERRTNVLIVLAFSWDLLIKIEIQNITANPEMNMVTRSDL